jgi:uncharacterized phage infection (PIP) family protein YhgE
MFLRGKQTNEPTDDLVPIVPPVAVPPAPSPAPAPAPLKGQTFDPGDVYAEDGKRWKDKFNGLRGSMKQLETGYQEQVGGLEQQIRGLQDQLSQAQATAGTLNAQIEQLRGSEAQVAALQQTVAELQGQANRAERFRILMNQPRLLNVRVEEQVPGENGAEPTTRIVNPFLDLVEKSDLEGEALQTLLNQMASAIPVPQQAPAPLAPPTIPPAPAPSGDDLSSLEKREKELRLQLCGGGATKEVQDEWQETWQKINKLREQQSTS